MRKFFTPKPLTAVEFFGGPLDGKVVDRSSSLVDGFLPSEMAERHWQGSTLHTCNYAADVARPTTAGGKHRYIYRP